ncbi:MAG: efflux RND transporter periplasmic adaptor subunit [Thermodesulfovibrionales bacterium]|nr:efflux RND transporter periplasmic adaptor subunit [Thermodesulfovibrionales bacterium]
MKRILIGVLIVIVLGIAAFFFLRNKDNGLKYRTEKITKGVIETNVTATGAVNAVTTVLVGTQVSGTIKNIYVDFNSPVKKGQLIALIDPSIFETQVEQARANLFSAKANLEKAEASLVDAKRTFERNKQLFSKDLIARSDVDTAETNNETAKAQVSASKAQIAQTGAALKNSQANLGYTRILSPVDGVVISRNVDVGQTVAASFQTPTLFTIAQDLTKMQINTNVGEADIGSMKVGQDVEFTVDAYPDITFKGRVWQVRNAPITIQNVVTYDVVIKMDNPELKLKPGMTANVSVIVSIKKEILKIPNAALRFKPLEKGTGTPAKGMGGSEKKGAGVWILENNKPKRIKVVTGMSDGNFTELVSGDIKVGDSTLREGQEVIVESLIKSKGQTSNNRSPRFF